MSIIMEPEDLKKKKRKDSMISQEESRKEDTPRRQDKKLNQNHTNKNPEQANLLLQRASKSKYRNNEEFITDPTRVSNHMEK